MKRYQSSSDSDDDMPLVRSTSRDHYEYQVITKQDLLENSLERCEFCDAVCYNKYKMLIHNASHIIIPLLKQSIHLCTKCNSPFNSIESLEKHEFTKHLNITNKNDYPEIMPSITKKEPYAVLTKEEFELKEEFTDTADILKSLVLKQPVTVLTKEKFEIDNREENVNENYEKKLLESFVNKNPITLLDPLVLKVDKTELIDDEIIDISDDTDDSNSMDSDIKTYLQESRIKDRILFEDDDKDDDIVATKNGVDVELELVNNDVRGSLKMNTIILGKHPSDSEYKNKCVHYDELVKPGLYKCRKCSESFPNRYNLIIHDTNHMRFKRRLPFLCKMCDWYVSNNPWGLKAHQNACHPGKEAPATEATRCKRCKLNYVHFYRHMRNYHDIYMCRLKDCKGSTFNGHEEYMMHLATHNNGTMKLPRDINASEVNGKDQDTEDWYTKTVKVCDLCLLFLKNRSNINYKLIKIISEVGVRHTCDQCGSMFFELNLISKICHRQKRRAEYGSLKKKVTNEDRLKSVQKRLKKIKFLNKF